VDCVYSGGFGGDVCGSAELFGLLWVAGDMLLLSGGTPDSNGKSCRRSQQSHHLETAFSTFPSR
jgi:hypothetical protein